MPCQMAKIFCLILMLHIGKDGEISPLIPLVTFLTLNTSLFITQKVLVLCTLHMIKMKQKEVNLPKVIQLVKSQIQWRKYILV